VADPTKRKPPAPKQVKTDSPASSDFKKSVEDRRVKDVGGARTIYNRLVQDNVQRSNTFANTRNQLEGGRPFNPADLEAQGAAWQTNVNFGDAQAARDRDFLPYWKMINDVPHRAAFTIDSNSTESDRWATAFAEAFDEFHEDWSSDYWVQFMKFAKNFVDFGPGMVQWTDPASVRYKAVNVQRVYFPKNTQMSPDEWEVMMLVRDVSATELYGYIRNPDKERQSAAAGWNINAIKAAIVQMKDGGQFPDYRDYTRYQDLLVNNDIVITSPFQPMTMVWLYVKNFDGKIGCYVFPQNQGVQEFLYEDDKAAESFRHLIGAVWYDTGTDGMVHSIKGFGIKNFFFSALINRMKCRIADAGTVASGMNFQYDQENVPDEAPPVENYGPFTVFPPGMKQLNIYPQLQPALGVLGMLSTNRDDNNALYTQSSQQQQVENADTATQAKILTAMQGQMSEASAAIFLAQVGENIYKEQVRRLRMRNSDNPDAKAFVRRLRERNVPEEVIFDVPVRVKTGANAGMANPILMTQKFQEGLALSNLPGVNQRWFLENVIAYKYGSQALNKALLPEGVNSQPQQRRQAIMENADLGQGIELPVAPEDAHFEHIEEHLKPILQIVQAFQQTQQITPEQVTAATIGLEHTGQHMTYLQQDETKKDQFQAVRAPFMLAQSTIRGILQRHATSQQPQDGVVPLQIAQ
jgi:hypothetical protein